MSRARVAWRAATVAAALLAVPASARAQNPPPPTFTPHPVSWIWEPKVLRVSVNYRQIINADIIKKINSGIPTVFVFSALLYEKGSKTPLAGSLMLKKCRATYDVWDEVYAVEIDQSGAGTLRYAAIATLDGVLRRCTQADRLLQPIERSQLKVGGSYELRWIVEVNPISEDLMDRIKLWISRPKGSATVGAGDALFGSFVGLFVAQIGRADRTLHFLSRNPVVVPPPPPPPPPAK